MGEGGVRSSVATAGLLALALVSLLSSSGPGSSNCPLASSVHLLSNQSFSGKPV